MHILRNIIITLLTAFCGCLTAMSAPTAPKDMARADSTKGRKVEQLREIVVTASEARGLTSGSRIDRAAMQHLQPTSFADLLELIPGNVSKDPDMGSASTITLRETGGVSATGQKTALGNDYAITSLGTSFVVDGAPVNNDANLQSVPLSGDSPSDKRTVVNRAARHPLGRVRQPHVRRGEHTPHPPRHAADGTFQGRPVFQTLFGR